MSTRATPKPRGFAALTPERLRQISHQGGVAAHLKGTAHQWNPITAREAGRKGGLSTRAKKVSGAPRPANDVHPPRDEPE